MWLVLPFLLSSKLWRLLVGSAFKGQFGCCCFIFAQFQLHSTTILTGGSPPSFCGCKEDWNNQHLNQHLKCFFIWRVVLWVGWASSQNWGLEQGSGIRKAPVFLCLTLSGQSGYLTIFPPEEEEPKRPTPETLPVLLKRLPPYETRGVLTSFSPPGHTKCFWAKKVVYILSFTYLGEVNFVG